MIDETTGESSDGAGPRATGTAVPAANVKAWFVREILPLEAMLMRYLRKSWRNESDIEELRQEV